jgi:protein-disulfide isomerase
LGFDTNAFDSCLDSGEYVDKVQQNTEDAHESGVTSTPTFVVDGAVVGSSIEALSAAIREAGGG